MEMPLVFPQSEYCSFFLFSFIFEFFKISEMCATFCQMFYKALFALSYFDDGFDVHYYLIPY